jgi:arsenate reductase-like glutaredoxin family protein
MANPLTSKITFIYHSQKLVDEQVISMLSPFQNSEIQLLNLANTEISIELLKQVASKLSNWQRVLLDTKYIDHSIKDPEHEFLLMDDSLKILFLKKNSWLIGTPLVIDNNRVFRFQNLSDAVEWLGTKNSSIRKNLTNHPLEVHSAL